MTSSTVRDITALLDADRHLDEDDVAMQSVVRQFVHERVRPHIAQWYEDGQVPARELARELGQLGVLGMHLKGYDCAGASATAYGLACMELEAGDSGLRSLVSVQGSLAMFAIWRWGSEEQKQEWLPRMAAGEAIGCFGLTEPDFGSDPGGMRTRARRDGSDWVLSGTKLWITNGTVSDVAVVWARTDEGIRGFVVPADTPGFTARDVKHKMSLCASVTSELSLDEVRLSNNAAFPEVRGLRGPLSCLNEARYGIVWGVVGAARDCIEIALEYAEERRIFDYPVSGYQLTQAKLADMSVEWAKAYLLAQHLGALKDAGHLVSDQVSLGKLSNVRGAIAIARECRTILGASGITTEYSPMRHANNLESVLTYEGTSEVHQLIVGRALTGHNAFAPPCA